MQRVPHLRDGLIVAKRRPLLSFVKGMASAMPQTLLQGMGFSP
jgi:hypothetical protein